MPSKPNLKGPKGQFYADPLPGPDEATFRVDNSSSSYYASAYYKLHKDQVQPVPSPRAGAALQLDLQDFIGPNRASRR